MPDGQEGRSPAGGPDEIDFDPDDLFAVLDDPADRRLSIEPALFNGRNKGCNRLFLHDAASGYPEGRCSELGGWGHNREGKKGKKRIVIGLLTDKDGDPAAVDVFKGNTSDPATVLDRIKMLSERFGAAEAVFVGDRGMLKRPPLRRSTRLIFTALRRLPSPRRRR